MSYDANSMVILFSAAIGNKRGQPSHQTFGPSYFVMTLVVVILYLNT